MPLTVVAPYWTQGDVYLGVGDSPAVGRLERVNEVTFRGTFDVPATGEYFFTRGTLATRSTTTFRLSDLPRGIHAVVDWIDSAKRIARPGFMKGAIFGGMLWRPEEIGIPGIIDYNLDLMRAAGYDWIGLVNLWFGFPDCRGSSSYELRPYYASDGPWPDTSGWSTPTLTDAQMRDIVARAKARGFKVMFKPMITSFAFGPDRPWFCHDMPEKLGWDRWFAEYTKFATHFARLAQETGVELFAIATELDLASKSSGTGAAPDAPARWRKTIAEIRKAYGGKLTWSVACQIGGPPNWHPWPCGGPQWIEFWDALDYIGFEPYFPITEKNDPTLAELKAGFASRMDSAGHAAAKALSERYGKPVVFTEYAPLAFDGANRDQQTRPGSPKVDEQEQTDQFEAIFETIEERSWIMGSFPWAWYLLKPGDDLAWQRTDINVFNGRPGGKVVEKWYRKIDAR